MSPPASPAPSSSAHSRHGSSIGAAAESEERRSHSSAAGSVASGSRSPSTSGSIPVETLVELLLRAKRSLSTMTLVLRANELTTHARALHEESVVLAAQTAFLGSGIAQQLRALERVRKGLARTYDSGKREFDRLMKTLDAASGRLSGTMNMLRATTVDPVFRPAGEEPRNLMDFVDELAVDKLINALKECVGELKAAETSFDGDLLRFDDDLRALKKLLATGPSLPSPTQSASHRPIPHLVLALTEQSHSMAENLTSLTRHFDLCVTAVRASEGGAALALRKAAEGSSLSGGDDPVSLSGVMRGAGGSSRSSSRSHHRTADEEPMSPRARSEAIKVVVQDAPEVEPVVADMQQCLQDMETDFAALAEQTEQIRAAHHSSLTVLSVLEEIGSRLASSVAAEKEFTDRCDAEKFVVRDRLEEVEALGHFYEGYARAYEGLLHEQQRRRAVDDKIQSVWRKAAEAAERLAEQDRAARRTMHADIGEFLPTDLWVGMNDPIRSWKVVPVTPASTPSPQEIDDQQAGGVTSLSSSGVKPLPSRRATAPSEAGSNATRAATPVIDKSALQTTRERLGRVR